MDVRVGISGWTYPPWRGVFYPPGLPQRSELAYAAERLNSVEINGTFYALQRPASFATWAAQVPDDFVFAIKGGRFITHMKKLAEPATTLPDFFASGVLALGPKLGPILWQLPPTLAFDAGRLASFCEILPRTHGQAAELAAHHDHRLAGDRLLITSDQPGLPIRHALEVRHDPFKDPAAVDLLRDHGVALVLADNPGRWPVVDEITSDFAYVRLHGDTELYASGYTDQALDAWADKIIGWRRRGLDVFVYCDNDTKVRAPYDAMGLLARIRART